MFAVAIPAVVGLIEMKQSGREALTALSGSASWDWSSAPRLAFSTATWGVVIAATATILGIPTGLALARHPSGRPTSILLTGLLLALLCFPSYMTYWVWGLAIQPMTSIGDWLSVSPERSVIFSGLRIWWGMSLWCWPLAALALTPAFRAVPDEQTEMALLDGASLIRRSWILLQSARGGLALAFGLTLVSTLTSYVVFDLAQTSTSFNRVYVYGNALRRLHADTYNHRAVILAAIPMMIVGAAAAAWVIRALRNPVLDDLAARTKHSRSGIMLTASWLMVTLSIAGPFALIGVYGHPGGIETVRSLIATDGRVLLQGGGVAIVSGCMIGLLGICFGALWSTRIRWVSLLASVQAIGWVWIGLVPAAATGALLVLAYNRTALTWSMGTEGRPFNPVYHTPVIVVLAHLARYAMLAVLFGRWIARSEPRDISDLRRIDAGRSFLGWFSAGGPRIVLPIGSLAVIGSALALSEVSVSVIVYPPGWQSPAERLLNLMHYGREDYVITMCLAMMALALACGVLAAGGFQRFRNRTAVSATRLSTSCSRCLLLALSALTIMAVAGCGNEDSAAPGPLNTVLQFGTPGRSPGQFVYPRAIDFDAGLQRIYIIDKTGRIQWFNEDGRIQQEWELPEYDQGYPTGISVNPRTHEVFVVDTHEHRITVFTPDGAVSRMFGSYGTEPGQMIFPTDIAFAPNGNLYVSEYGGNDRIQVFDQTGSEVLFQIGEPGREDGQFSRPECVVYDAQRAELWIADSCNHRLVVTDPEGRWLFTVGQAGTQPGDLSYPYSILLQEDRTVLVAEYGNNRIQHLDRSGKSLGIYGETGQEAGYLKTPWAMTASNDLLYILDSGNNRVQVIRRPK